MRQPKYVTGEPVRDRRRTRRQSVEPTVVQSSNRQTRLRIGVVLVFLVPVIAAAFLSSRGITPASLQGSLARAAGRGDVRPVNSEIVTSTATPTNTPAPTATERSLVPQYSYSGASPDAPDAPAMRSTVGGWLLQCQDGQRLVFTQHNDGLGSAVCEEFSSSSLIVETPPEPTPAGGECDCE